MIIGISVGSVLLLLLLAIVAAALIFIRRRKRAQTKEPHSVSCKSNATFLLLLLVNSLFVLAEKLSAE